LTPGSTNAVRRVLREDHLGASTFVEKGWNLIANGSFEEAEAVLLHALELAPSDVRGRAMLGWARMRQGLYDEAQELFANLLSENSLHAMVRVNLGYVCFRKGDLARAADLLTHASRHARDPKAALYACFYLGLLLAAEENFIGAESCFRRTVFLAPSFIEGYYELGRAQLAAGHATDARETWKLGHQVNRFNIWGKRCAEALRVADRGEKPISFS
jgi:tetratricopeptide (TPR) repeat protein